MNSLGSLENYYKLSSQGVLPEESLSQLTHRIAFRFPYSAVGKVPGDTERVLDYSYGKQPALSMMAVTVEDGENDLLGSLLLLKVSKLHLHLIHSVVFFLMGGPSSKARAVRRYEHACCLVVSSQRNRTLRCS